MNASSIRSVSLPNGGIIPALGMGTWYMGEVPARHETELAALRTGIENGLTLIDTAEMYGGGAAEVLVGEAIADHRDEVYLVSKVLPSHASLRGTVTACQSSLRRLGTDHLDMYLLHWRGRYPLAETVEALESLKRSGLIGCWGVSNFDASDMDQLIAVPGGDEVQTNQVLYNLARRGPEYDLLPWCQQAGMPLMSYSPVDHGELLGHPAMLDMATSKGVTTAQLAIAWALRLPEVCAIAKASTPEHMIENRDAAELTLSQAELDQLDSIFPPPSSKVPLEMR
jgi:diketogulonate reductase-like aldo/keto reductase